MHTVTKHTELRVYQAARASAAKIFKLTLRFPPEERYGLTAQIRNCSRSVGANIPEAWRKRRYTPAFRNKLSDAEGEAAETQWWLDCAMDCNYITPEEHEESTKQYDSIIAQLVKMSVMAPSFANFNKQS